MILHIHYYPKIDDECFFTVVDNKEKLRSWLSMLEAGLFSGYTIDAALFENAMKRPDVKMYLAYAKDEPAGGSMQVFFQELTGLFLISVSPQFRRRGIGTLLAVQPLREAREAGYCASILRASEMGRKIYSKIGFHDFFIADVYSYIL